MTIQSKFMRFLLRPAVLAAASIAIVTSAATATAYHFSTEPAAPTEAVAPAKAGSALGSTTGNTEELVSMAESRRNRDDAERYALMDEIAEDYRGVREQERWGGGGSASNEAAWKMISEKLDRLRNIQGDSEAMTKIITTYK